MSLKAWDKFGILDREIYLYNELINKGIDTTVFTYGTDNDIQYAKQLDGIEVIPGYQKKIPTTKVGRMLTSLILPYKFRKYFYKYDILKTNQMHGAWVPLIVKWITGKKLLVRCGFEQYQFLIANKTAVLKRWFYYILSKAVYLSGDAIIVTSPSMADFICSTFTIDRRKITVYSNLIDTDLFCFSEMTKKSQKLLFVGRLNTQKNLFNLVNAVKKVDIPLTVIGEGELLPKLQNHATRIRADVTFIGQVPNPELPSLIAQHNLFLLPSFYEGNPKVLLEAMSCGRAVIGTDVPGINNIISDGENGILCGTDSDSIAGAINRLKENRELIRNLGREARRYVEQNCSLDNAVATELNIYKSLLS